MNQLHRRQQLGYTLVELIAAMAVLGVVLTSVAIAISSLHRLNRRLRDDVPGDAQIARLGLQFRSDLHASRSIATAQPPVEKASHNRSANSVVHLKMENDRMIEYQAVGNRVLRTVPLDAPNKRLEAFPLPPETEVSWSIAAESGLVTMSIQRRLGKTPGSADDLRVTAVTAAIGLDHLSRVTP